MKKVIFVENYETSQLQNNIKDLVFNDLKGEFEIIIRKVKIANLTRWNVVIKEK